MSIDWNIVQTAIPLLARGTVVTLQISLVAGVLACIIGFELLHFNSEKSGSGLSVETLVHA